MKNNFLINKITLEATADKIREFIGGTDVFISDIIIGLPSESVQEIVIKEYYEEIDGVSNEVKENGQSNQPNQFLGAGYEYNNENKLVPVLYRKDESVSPTLLDKYYYIQNKEIDGILYSQWRKIEMVDEEEKDVEFATWDSSFKSYVYTNVIVEQGKLLINPLDFPNKIEEIHQAGKVEGENLYNSTFWKNYQNEGQRTDYQCAFSGDGWTNETFSPLYQIKVLDAYHMFYNSQITDGYKYIKNIDFSECTRFNSTFKGSHLKHIGVIDCSGLVSNNSSLPEIFNLATALETIDKIIVSSNIKFTDSFRNTIALKNIAFEGEIGKDLALGGTYNRQPWGENLSKESIINVINSLSTTSSGTLTLSNSAVQAAFFDVGVEGGEWDQLCNSKTNWTINLV